VSTRLILNLTLPSAATWLVWAISKLAPNPAMWPLAHNL
jgi:hypothetical protein